MELGLSVTSSNDWCDALYFPSGRHKFGGVHCRLEPNHAGDHWCEREDEMAEEQVVEDELGS